MHNQGGWEGKKVLGSGKNNNVGALTSLGVPWLFTLLGSLQLSLIPCRPESHSRLSLGQSHLPEWMLKSVKFMKSRIIGVICNQNSTEPAMFLQIFQTPLLLNLFFSHPHLPTKIISQRMLNRLYSPKCSFPKPNFDLYYFFFFKCSPCFAFQKIVYLWNLFIYNVFQDNPEPTYHHSNIFFFGGGGGCVHHSLVTWHTLLYSELSFSIFYPPSCIA